MNDKAIEYETLLHKTNRVISNLKNVGIDVTRYENIIDDITNECKKEIDKGTKEVILDDSAVSVSCYLESSYIKAMSRLEKLLQELDKYEVYLRVASLTGILREFLKKKNKEEKDLADLRVTLISILEDLKKSGTLSYEVEGKLVNDIYSLVYDFIKEEIKKLNNSPTLEILQADEIHKYNLDKFIIKELENMNLKDPKNRFILLRKNELDLEGVDTHYVDEELIRKIVAVTDLGEYYERKCAELNQKISDYYNKLDSLYRNDLVLEKGIKEAEEFHKKSKKRVFTSIPLFISAASLIIGLFGSPIKLAFMGGKVKKYKIDKTTISSLDGSERKEELYLNSDDKTLFIEVKPYEKYKGKSFSRDLIKYDVSGLGDLSIDDYLSIDFDELGIEGKKDTENKETLTLDDLYNETFYLIEKYVVDENDIKETTEPLMVFFGMVLFELLAALLWMLLEVLIDCFKKDGDFFLVSSIKNIIKSIRDLKESKASLSEKKEKLMEIKKQFKELYLENEETIRVAASMLKDFEDIEGLEEQTENLSYHLKRVKKMEAELTQTNQKKVR